MIPLSLDEVRELAPGRLRGRAVGDRRTRSADRLAPGGARRPLRRGRRGGRVPRRRSRARGRSSARPGRRLRGARRARRPGARPELGTVRRDHRVDGEDVDEGHPRGDLRAPAADGRRRAQLQRRDRRAADDRPRRARHRALHPRAGDARLRPDRRALRVRPAPGRRDHERRPGPSGAGRRPRRRRPRQGRADRRASGRRDGDRAGGLPRRARRPRGRPRRSRRHPRSVRATRAAHVPRHRRGRLHCAASGRQRAHGVRDGERARVCDCRPSSTSRSPPGGTRRSRSRAEACSSTTPGTRTPSRCAQRSSTSSSSRTAGARSPCSGTWPSWAPTATRVTARSAARSSSWESTRWLRSDPRAAAYGGRHVDAVDEAIALLEEIVRPGDCVLVKAARAMGLERVAESLTRVTA